jgi:hypothetical protein
MMRNSRLCCYKKSAIIQNYFLNLRKSDELEEVEMNMRRKEGKKCTTFTELLTD